MKLEIDAANACGFNVVMSTRKHSPVVLKVFVTGSTSNILSGLQVPISSPANEYIFFPKVIRTPSVHNL